MSAPYVTAAQMSEITLLVVEDKKRIAALEAERDTLLEQVGYLRGLLSGRVGEGNQP